MYIYVYMYSIQAWLTIIQELLTWHITSNLREYHRQSYLFQKGSFPRCIRSVAKGADKESARLSLHSETDNLIKRI